MGMSRAQANTYLANQYGALATLTGQLATDSATGYGPAIDDALLKLGVAYSSIVSYTVDDGLVNDYRVLLRLFALRQFESQLASNNTFEMTGDGVKAKEAAELMQVRALLAEATQEATALGYITRHDILRMGRLTLDFLEPKVTS